MMLLARMTALMLHAMCYERSRPTHRHAHGKVYIPDDALCGERSSPMPSIVEVPNDDVWATNGGNTHS